VRMTFKQAHELGAHVRQREKGSLVVYTDTVHKTETDEQTREDVEKAILFMKGYTVFNAEQVDDLPIHDYASRNEGLKRFFRNTGDRAYFSVNSDHVQMPPFPAFRDPEGYYATLAHEMTHWTRHPSRLERDFGRRTWGYAGYANEELVDELGAAFLCADLGITHDIRDDHAAYIADWFRVLKGDTLFIFSAAAHA
ncbi:MAG: ArdC family protein, partial [Gammaproteobacteria bacterium]